jgi:hypothetical protein
MSSLEVDEFEARWCVHMECGLKIIINFIHPQILYPTNLKPNPSSINAQVPPRTEMTK